MDVETKMISFGSKLKQLRETTPFYFNGKSHLSQDAFGRKVGEFFGGVDFSRDTVAKWENGNTIIRVEERTKLIAIIQVLHNINAIVTREEADTFLQYGKYGILDEKEVIKIDLTWAKVNKPEPKSREKSFNSLPSSFMQPRKNIPFLAPFLPKQGVFGRENAIEQIDTIFNKEVSSDPISLALRGMGGIGKTTLAIKYAHINKVKLHFPDGILWTSLGPNPTIRSHLHKWGTALGIDIVPELDEKSCQERLSDLLYEREILIVIDDVWNIKDGLLFQVGGPKSRTLITTREPSIANSLVTLENIIKVDVLQPKAALELLQKLAPAVVDLDKKSAEKLCERLEYLPLGLTLAGRFLTNEAEIPSRMQRLLSELIEKRDSRLRLTQIEGRLGIDEENPVSLQAILGMSVERLSKANQERFAMISVLGGEPFLWDSKEASFVWDCSIEEAEETIALFLKRGLVENRSNKFWMHSLLADYANELLGKMGL